MSISGLVAPGSTDTPQEGVTGEVIAFDTQADKTLWKAGVDGVNIQRLTVAADGNLYMQVDNHVEALNGSSGARLWSVATDVRYQILQLVVSNSAVYVEQVANPVDFDPGSAYDSALVRALRLNDGHEIWRQGVSSASANSLTSIQADDQAVYLLKLGSDRGVTGPPTTTLSALNARDGSPLWSGQPQQGEIGQDYELYLSGQTLYIRGAKGVDLPGVSSLSAYQSQSGARLWTWQTPFALSPFAPPDHIYGSSQNNGENLCALKSSDGSKVWCVTYNPTGAVLFGQGRIYMVAVRVTSQLFGFNNHPELLYILNERDGSLIAQYSPGDQQTTNIADLALS